MPASASPQLQTPLEQRQVHYISDNVFSLGTLSCAVCGHVFPTHTNVWQKATCSFCGTVHEPGTFSAFQRQLRASNGSSSAGVNVSNKVCSVNTSAALFFTEEEIALATAYIRETLGDELEGSSLGKGSGVTRRAGQTEVDNRVIEDAFCEACGVHRPCKTFARQTRSADEGQTIFFQCTTCGAEWQQNS